MMTDLHKSAAAGTIRALSENLQTCQQLANGLHDLQTQQQNLQRQVAQLTSSTETTGNEELFEIYDVAVSEAFMAYQSAVERLLEANMHLNRMHDSFNRAILTHHKIVSE